MSFRSHPSIPFLTAAIAALFLYRALISLFGLQDDAIFRMSIAAAAVVAAAWLLGDLIWPLREE